MTQVENHSLGVIRTLQEMMVLLLLSVGIGAIWNCCSSGRIDLNFDYFPAVNITHDEAAPLTDEDTLSIADWRGRGVIPQDALVRLLADRGSSRQTIALIDARKEEFFERGHLAGAKKLDRYRFAQDLPIVLPICLRADLVVVYCQGGACDDSHIAGKILSQAGVSADAIVILEGGLERWLENKREVVQ